MTGLMRLLIKGVGTWLLLAIAGLGWAAVGGDVLRAPILPRAIALGGAYTGLAEDIGSTLYNPAGLARLQNTQVALMHDLGLIDTTEYVAFGKAMKAGGAIAGSLLYRHLPTIDNPGAADSAVDVSDLLVSISYGLGFKTEDKGGEDLAAGINLKWLSSKLAGFQASTLAVDLGMLYRPNELKELQLGLCVQNMGTALQFESMGDELPLSIAGGAAYQVYSDKNNTVSMLADLVVPVAATGLLQLKVGAEYWIGRLIAVRLGYQYQKDALVNGISAGLGFQTSLGNSLFELDYAYKPMSFAAGDNSAQHSVSVMLGF